MSKITKSQIAKQNDLMRSTMIQVPTLKVLMTSSVSESEHREDVISAVRSFNTFTKDNDPHKEHDFGAVTIAGEKWFWKFDYYDDSYEYGADPSEGSVCRVLTIMHSSDY